MKPTNRDDWLEAALEAEPPPIEDAGFSAAVIARLPTPRRHRLPRLVFGVVAAAGAAASLAIAAPSLGALQALEQSSPTPSSMLITAMLLLAFAWVPATMALEER